MSPYTSFQSGRWVTLPGNPVCPTCHGEGERGPRDYDTGAVCPDCEGWGTVQWTEDELAEAEEIGRATRREASEHRDFDMGLQGDHDSPWSRGPWAEEAA